MYNQEIPRLLQRPHEQMILARDFNCVVNSDDCTGHPTTNRALKQLITGLKLQDAWAQRRGDEVYTHYTLHGASRIDRIYITQNLLPYKKHTETVAAALTDHLAEILNIESNNINTVRGNGYWKVNTSLLKDEQVNEVCRSEWTKWKHAIHHYPKGVMCWSRLAKNRIHCHFCRMGK